MDWNLIPEEAVINKTMDAMKAHNFNPVIVADRTAALAKLRELIPSGADVMTGSSTTLDEIGFTQLLISKQHPWQNWKDRILPEKDPQKQSELRRQSTTATYFLGSLQAVTQDGLGLGVDASGSRQGGYVFSAKNVIWVIGINKIVENLDMAYRRLYEHIVPLEDARMKKQGAPGTSIGKLVVYHRESVPNRISTVLVREKLGF